MRGTRTRKSRLLEFEYRMGVAAVTSAPVMNSNSNFYCSQKSETKKRRTHAAKVTIAVSLTLRMSDAATAVTFQVKINKTRARTLCSNLRGCGKEKKTLRFPECKAKIKAICRFSVMSICRGQLLFFLFLRSHFHCLMQRIRKGQAGNFAVCSLFAACAPCGKVNVKVSLSPCIDSFQLHFWHALCAHIIHIIHSLFIRQFCVLLINYLSNMPRIEPS